MDPHLIIGLPLFVVAFLNALLGFIILQKNPHNKNLNKVISVVGFSAALYALFAGIVYIRGWMGLDYSIYYRACHIGWFAVPAFFQAAYYIQDDKSRKALIVGSVLYVFWAVVDTLNLTTDWIELGAKSLVPYAPLDGPFEIPVRIIGALLCTALIVKLFHARSQVTGLKRAQLNYFILGGIIYSAGGLTGTGFLALFGGFGMDAALVSYFSFPWLALTFYAITRYKLFDIQIILSNTVTIMILTVGLSAIDIVIFKCAEPYLGSYWANLISLGVIITLFLKTPLLMKVQGSVNDVFLGNKYNYQTILKDSSRAITSILDQDELLNHLINTIQQSFKIHKACLFLKGSNDDYVLRYDWGVDKKITENYKISDSTIVAWLNEVKHIFIKEEQQELLSPQKFAQLYGNLGMVEAELIIPLFFKERLVGFFTLGRKGDDRPYVQSDIDILETLASQAAIAIENARLYNEAIIDGLTGLYHHKYFMLRLNEEMQRCKRHKSPLSLLMIDIDHFKSINDTYGHLAGDVILGNVALQIKNNTRTIDIVARYGGEEFAVLLPETDGKGAMVVAERLRKIIEDLEVKTNIKVTISIGINSLGETSNATSANEFIDQADKALYRAKQNGRNRVEVASAPCAS